MKPHQAITVLLVGLLLAGGLAGGPQGPAGRQPKRNLPERARAAPRDPDRPQEILNVKPQDLRRCDGCRGPLGLEFVVVTVAPYKTDLKACSQIDALAQYFGSGGAPPRAAMNVALAMAPADHVALPSGPPSSVLLCLACQHRPDRSTAELVEAAAEHLRELGRVPTADVPLEAAHRSRSGG